MITPRRLGSLGARELDRLLRRGRLADPELASQVATLLDQVRDRGDDALREQTLRFDGVRLDRLEVPRPEWAAALRSLPADLRAALEEAAVAIGRFHQAQAPSPLVVEAAPGLTLGRRPDPLRRVGVYAPGGRAAYPSSVLMGVVPARVAGVEEVIVCSPSGPDGQPPALVMAACAVAGADRLFALGGAGAIGAMALGTEMVPAVDLVVGPGNAWVTEAKRQLSGTVGIDSLAGPSELLVVADAGADPDVVAGELLAQAEHDPDAAAVLVTTDVALADDVASDLARLAPREPRTAEVTASLAASGAILVADHLDQALEFTERYAPEHLLLLVDEPRAVLRRTRCAGTVFLGPLSSVAFGDYATGANHVLPTGGMARSSSGLSIDDFFRWTTWQEVRPDAVPGLTAIAATMARAEGLPAHAAAADAAARRAGAVERVERVERGGEAAGMASSPLPRKPYRSMGLYDPARRPVELDLSANTNLWGACSPALETLRDAVVPSSYPSPYADELKSVIAEVWELDPAQVVTGCGSDDLIDSAIRAFCEPGDTVAFPAPTFPMTEVFAAMNDARSCPVPMGPAGELEPAGLAALAAADVVYLCRPNNPTGALIPEAQVLELLERARALVLLDEAYAEYAGETLLEPALEAGRTVVLRTFSKAYGLAGLRVGYALGPEPLVRVIERSRGPYKVGAQAERAAIAAMRHGGPWLRETVADAVQSRESLATRLRSRGLRVFDSHANFLLFAPPVTVPAAAAAPSASLGAAGDSAAGHPAAGPTPGTGPGWAVSVRASLLERGIGVRAFPALDGVGEAIRVTVAPEPLMDRFVEALDEALQGVEVAR